MANMESIDPIRNRVAASGVVVLSIADFLPATEDLRTFDVSEGMDGGLVLREKPFRAWLEAQDFAQFAGKWVAVSCGTEAIVPPWAYVLACVKLRPSVRLVTVGSLETLRQAAFSEALSAIDWSTYEDKKVMLKGCGSDSMAFWSYAALSLRLLPHVSTLMYGEPCSTVPIYKKSRG